MAKDIMRRVMPETKMLMPNSVPTTQAEFHGQWAQIRIPSRRVTMASKSTHPQPLCGRILNANTSAKIPYTSRNEASSMVSASNPARGCTSS